MYSTPLKSRVDYNNNVAMNTLGSSIGVRNVPYNDVNANSQGELVRHDAVNGLNTGSLISNPLSGAFSDGIVGNNVEHLKVHGLDTTEPLELARQYIDYLHMRDNSTPVLDERSYYNNGVNYNFTKELGGLGAFTPFERQQIINIPDEILKESAKTEIKSDMGIFQQINRCWISIDNKLIFWNINDSTDFQTIDEIKHTILKIALIKPKKNTFVDYINYLLIVVTPFDIYIFAVEYKHHSNEMNIYNTGMSVSVHGLDVFDFVTYDKTGQIFFSGRSDGVNIWELQYSGSDDWYNSKCTKVCLTQSALSNLLPTNIISKVPGAGLIQSLFEEESRYSQEYLIQLSVDQSRGIIYTLSSKSITRAYLISKNVNSNSLIGPLTIEPAYIRKIIGTTTARSAAILQNKYLKIAKIVPVSQHENKNLFLVAITVGGVRLYFNGSIGRSNIEAIRLESIKFPPSSVTPQVIQQELQKEQLEQQKKSAPFFSSLASSESVLLRFQKKSSVLLETTNASTIVSPGIYFAAVTKTPQEQEKKVDAKGKVTVVSTVKQPTQHKLFVSVPDYGILKNHGKYIENATFLETTAPVKEIVQLTESFNATTKPEGYANVFATQYSAENLKVAVLTNSSIEIYRYRTPDEIFEALSENPLPFLMNYGVTEACSTALYVACKSNKSDTMRSAALTFFFVGLPGIVNIKPKYNRYASPAVSNLFGKSPLVAASTLTTTANTPQKSSSTNFQSSSSNKSTNYNLDDVFLSPRFYGTGLLITRLFRDIWEKPVFDSLLDVQNQKTLYGTSNNNKYLISGISVSKLDVDYYLSSITILNEFFNVYGSSLTAVYTPLLSNGTSAMSDKSEGVAHQAENTAISALIQLVKSIQEALSFLKVLYEETEAEGPDNQHSVFKEIFAYLNSDVQQSLSQMRFKTLFSPNNHTKSLVREVLSSIINKNITRGASIEFTATALQNRCGSFCSSSDILGFRAVEHLRKAKEIGMRDYESLSYHLNNAIRLFEKIVNDISIDKLKEAVKIMLDLKYYPRTIQFLLNIANSMDQGNLAMQYVTDGMPENDSRKKIYEKRIMIYDIVFETLIKVDQMASQCGSFTSTVVLNEWENLRKDSYAKAFGYKDKLFNYQLYDWLVSQHQEEKLLNLDTEYVLSFLREKAKDSFKIANLLWIYYSKESNFYEAANTLYHLALSDFEIKLGERIEFLSRANGFCNSVCPPNQKQNMVQLASKIQEIFDVAATQDDILSLVVTDNRIDEAVKTELINQLDGKFLSVNDLFNDFAVPLGYYEVCLNIYKVSDFRNQEEIMNTWTDLFNSLKRELNDSSRLEDSINFLNLVSSVVTKVGKTVHNSEFVFPIQQLFSKISTLLHEALPAENIAGGTIASIFINSGVSYNKLYFILRDLIETKSDLKSLYDSEMVWLIKKWYQSDRKLKDTIDYIIIEKLDHYHIDNDPVDKFLKQNAISI